MNRRLAIMGILALVASSIYNNLRGPLLPLFIDRYQLSHGQASLFMFSGYLGSLLLSWPSGRMIHRYGTLGYFYLMMGLQCLVMVSVAWAPSRWVFIVLGSLWGAAQMGLAFAANFFVLDASRPDSRARMMNGLHIFYGLASVVPGLAVPIALSLGFPLWKILIGSMAFLPLVWAYSLGVEPASLPERTPSGRRAMPEASALSLALSFYVIAEVLISTWLVEYLHESAGYSVRYGSIAMAVFFLALGLSRSLAYFSLPAGSERWVTSACLTVSAIGLVAGLHVAWPAFLLAAFTMGPIYPTTIALLAGDELSSDVDKISSAVAMTMVSMCSGQLLFGWIADWTSLKTAFHLPILCLLAALFLFWRGYPRSIQDSDSEPAIIGHEPS